MKVNPIIDNNETTKPPPFTTESALTETTSPKKSSTISLNDLVEVSNKQSPNGILSKFLHNISGKVKMTNQSLVQN